MLAAGCRVDETTNVDTGGGPPVVRDSVTSAVLVATSVGDDSFRFHSDVARVARELLDAGLTNDDLLVVADPPLVTRVDAGVEVDRSTRDATPDQILDAVRAQRGDGTLLVYVSGHGTASGVQLRATSLASRPAPDLVIEPVRFAGAIGDVGPSSFDDVVLAVDACFAGVYGDAVARTRPKTSTLALAAASATQYSYSADRSSRTGEWRSNEFGSAFIDELDTARSWRSLAHAVRARVHRSDVQVVRRAASS